MTTATAEKLQAVKGPLARVIQEHITKPLADEILFGRLVRGGHVKVDLRDGKLVFDIDGASGETRPGEIVVHPDTDLSEDSGEPALAE